MNAPETIISRYVELASINVNSHVEKKNGLSYLSWAWAVDQLLRHDPAANWEFHDPKMYGETMMVSCTVTAFNKPVTMHLPVMDHRNQAIKNPDAFAVNKNMMRCLVKAIACHGLGLYIYAGEDLPEEDKKGPITGRDGAFESFDTDMQTAITDCASEINHAVKTGSLYTAYGFYTSALEWEVDDRNMLMVALDDKMDQDSRLTIKAIHAAETARSVEDLDKAWGTISKERKLRVQEFFSRRKKAIEAGM